MEARGSQTHSKIACQGRIRMLLSACADVSIAFMFPIKVQSREIYVYASFPARFSCKLPFPFSIPTAAARRSRLISTVARMLKSTRMPVKFSTGRTCPCRAPR